MPIITRAEKQSELTHQELDNNFTELLNMTNSNTSECGSLGTRVTALESIGGGDQNNVVLKEQKFGSTAKIDIFGIVDSGMPNGMQTLVGFLKISGYAVGKKYSSEMGIDEYQSKFVPPSLLEVHIEEDMTIFNWVGLNQTGIGHDLTFDFLSFGAEDISVSMDMEFTPTSYGNEIGVVFQPHLA